jgi:hypothetical protein
VKYPEDCGVSHPHIHRPFDYLYSSEYITPQQKAELRQMAMDQGLELRQMAMDQGLIPPSGPGLGTGSESTPPPKGTYG